MDDKQIQQLIEQTVETALIKNKESTKEVVDEAIAKHEEDMHTFIEAKLGTSHDSEHRFIRKWMDRVDSMGNSFFAQMGRLLAYLFLGILSLIALFTLGAFEK